MNLDMTDSMGPGKLVRHMQNPSYTYDEYLICIGLGPSISSVICKNLSYSGPSYPSSPVLEESKRTLFPFFSLDHAQSVRKYQNQTINPDVVSGMFQNFFDEVFKYKVTVTLRLTVMVDLLVP